MEAVRGRCGLEAGTLVFDTAGVLTSIVFRLKLLGDLLRVYFSRFSGLQKKISRFFSCKKKVENDFNKMTLVTFLMRWNKMNDFQINEKSVNETV